MKYPIALLSAVFSISAWSAGNLSIGAGETFTVGPEQQRLMLDTLTIGDGARIRFEDGIYQWQLRAQQARIGEGVVIEASGVDGKDGADGRGFDRSAGECSAGKDGTNGGSGTGGSNGVSLRMQLGLVEMGSLNIVSSGGDAGNGGAGGNGQDAGAFTKSCKSAPDGGDAGNGGNGGDGGNAGDVTVLYWAVAEKLAGMDVAERIVVEAEAGSAGVAGEAGKRGDGSEGGYIRKRTLAGDRAWVSGGSKGRKGEPGVSGKSGQRGSVLIEPALVTSQPVVVAPAAAPTAEAPKNAQSEQEIKELKDTLKALMKRLDELEQKQ